MNRKDQTKRLKIAVLIRRFITTGGAEKYAVEVTRRLRMKGHHIDLYAREVDSKLLDGLNFFPIKNRLAFSSVLNSYSFAHDVALKLKEKSYDVIHSHECGYSRDISTVHTFSYIKGIEKYSPIRKIDQLYLSPKSWLYFWLDRRQIRASMVAAVSETVKKDIEKYYHRKLGVSVIPPGVDLNWFQPQWVAANRERLRQEANISDKELVILFVGSEFKRKGLDSLIPTIGTRMRLLVVGAGERHHYYRQLVKRFGVSDRIVFKGLSDDIRNEYAVADVVVLPSLIEAFGMSILEGMACGLPVVSSLNAGVSALVKNGINGFTFRDPGNLPKIFKLLYDHQLRERLGAEARKTAETYSWDVVADKYEKLCYQIAENKKSMPSFWS